MLVLVVVESSFGNTRAIADSVATGMSRFATVDLRPVAEAPEVLAGVDLLVVGGPTHTFGMSRPDTRKEAARRSGHDDAADVGVREWMERISSGVGWFATFDTRIDKGWIPGSAAKAMARRLRGLDGTPLAEPESFHVAATEGPLLPGETDRAERWGEGLARLIAAAMTRSTN